MIHTNLFNQNATHLRLAAEENIVGSLIVECTLPPDSVLPICANSNEANARLKNHENAPAFGPVRNLYWWEGVVLNNHG